MVEISIQRHRRASGPQALWPSLEPGELAVNTYTADMVVGNADPASLGSPVAMVAIRPFMLTAVYMNDNLVVNQGQVWRCKYDGVTGAWDVSRWEQLTGIKFSMGVFTPTPVLNYNYIAQPNDWCRVDTRQHLINITLQSMPMDGTSLRITDVAGNFVNNPCYVLRNGNLINGLAENLELRDTKDTILLFSTGLGWTAVP